MKKWLLVLLLSTLGVQVILADFGSRTFTSKDGKQELVATPVGYDRVKFVIYLRMKDGKTKNFDLSKFSIADQLFIEDKEQKLSEMFRLMKMPRAIKARFSQVTRKQLLKSHQTAVGSEQALDRFLSWLKTTQNPDGSWTSWNKVSMTSMALLVYFGRGETPNSKGYGETVTQAIVYLVQVAERNKGRLTEDVRDKHWPYQHAMATLALGEAQTICGALKINIPKLKIATKLAGDWILEHQHSSGAWGYDRCVSLVLDYGNSR